MPVSKDFYQSYVMLVLTDWQLLLLKTAENFKRGILELSAFGHANQEISKTPDVSPKRILTPSETANGAQFTSISYPFGESLGNV